MASTTQNPTRTPELTAVVVEVPAAEAAVGRWRARYDRAARAGVPAHVTVCFPFVDQPDEGVLADIAATTSAFDLTFATTRTFEGPVLWLAPDPAEPFRELTRRVCAAFDVLPYGGAHGRVEDAVPHLTVAEQPEDLDAVRADVERGLPIRTRVEALTLLQGRFEPGGWRVRRRFPLGP